MHEPSARSQTPEGRRLHFVSRRLPAVLNDAVAGSDVVQEEIAERFDALVAQRLGHLERAAIDPRAGRSGDDLRRVAGVAADGQVVG